MNQSLRALAFGTSMDAVVTVLAISPRSEDHAALQAILTHSNWTLFHAKDCRHAQELLPQIEPGVVVCQHDLPDGNWLDIQNLVAHMEAPPPVIVYSPDANDRLWGEVLNLGGYDVLAEPFDATEVIRIVSLGWRHWREVSQQVRRPPTQVLRMAAAAAG